MKVSITFPWRDDQWYTLYRSVVVMLWLIIVYIAREVTFDYEAIV